MKRGVPDNIFIVLEELSWLGYVTPIFAEGLFYQWTKRFGKDVYDSVDSAINDVIKEHNTNKINIVGHSLGGLKAISYTLFHPEKVSTCMTITSPFGGTSKAILGILQFVFGVYSPSIFQLLPFSKYIQSLKSEIKDLLPFITQTYDTKFVNVWSTADEFVSKKSSSLEDILGQTLSNVEEHTVHHGHAASFYCNTTLSLLNSIVSSPFPTILLHGFTLNKHFFDVYINTLDYRLQDKVYAISYDYAKPLQV